MISEEEEILEWWNEQSSWASWEDCHKQAKKDIKTLVKMIQTLKEEFAKL